MRTLLSPLAALLPAPERNAVAVRFGLDVLHGTWLLALVQVFGGGLAWAGGALAFIQHVSKIEASGILEQAGGVNGVSDAEAGYALIATGPLAYLISPQGLALEYVFFTGLFRLIHVLLHRECLGDPLLSLLLWGYRRLRSDAALRERLAELGPERPDRVLEHAGGLVILASREKPDWDVRTTVQVGDAFYRLRRVEDRKDGPWTAIAYVLAPVELGAVFRKLIRYGEEMAPPEPATAVVPQYPGVPSPRPAPPSPGRHRKAGEGRRWRVDDGEQARLTPEGPHAALIESQGFLPLRTRTEAGGVHHRPAMPGTAVALGGELYEAVAESLEGEGVVYSLDPWPAQQVLRDHVNYGPRLVRAAQRERQRAARHAKAERFAPLLYPLVGLLPETRQILACDRFGLDARMATFGGAMLEIGAGLMLTFGLGAAAMAAAVVLGLGLVLPAVLRAIGALAFGEVAGSPLFELGLGLWRSLRPRLERFDQTVLPLTREAFWARLALPDRQQRFADGTLLVRGILPHLDWGPNLLVEGDHWHVETLPPAVEKGRLIYGYRLAPLRAEDAAPDLPAPIPPHPRLYQEQVLEQVQREWDALLLAGAWLASLLPASAQERAFSVRGGPAAARRPTMLTATLTLLGALWLLASGGVLGPLLGILLLADAALRLARTARGRYATSLLGWPMADYLRPERVAYQAHRDAERAVLAALR